MVIKEHINRNGFSDIYTSNADMIFGVMKSERENADERARRIRNKML